VRARERRGALGEPLVHAQPGGERLGRQKEAAAGIPDERAEPPRAESLGGRVDRDQPDGVHGCAALAAERLVLGHPELPAAAEAPV
jgi:hypothetical protein